MSIGQSAGHGEPDGGVWRSGPSDRDLGRVRVRFTVTAKDAASRAVPVTCTPRSGSLFKRGRTEVTCSATDANGNTATATFAVAVKR